MKREFQTAAGKTLHGFILSGLLAVVGLGILGFGDGAIDDHILTGIFALAMSAAAAGHTWWTNRDPTPPLRIDDNGVWFREWGQTVPWADIADAYQGGTRLQPFVILRIRDPKRFIAGLDPAGTRALRGNRLWKAPELRIPVSAVAANPREVLDAVLAGPGGPAA